MKLLILFLALACGTANAFPTKPVKIIVAFPPGGGTDIVSRLLAPRLTDLWGQAVVVENRAGASGTIGTEIAARADPDGHTLFMATMGNMTANQHLYPKMAVDPLRAFAPITKVVDVHFVFIANPTLAASSVKELIELARKPSRRNPLQLLGAGRRTASRHGALQASGGRQPDARAVQGQRPGNERPSRRPGDGDDG
jgi:tripartite-type tricarboxylate transporter receptor subunit TctC